MAITSKLYRCTNCNHEYKLDTNHMGACYPVCEKCRKQAQHVCIEPEVLEAAKAKPFTKVKIVPFKAGEVKKIQLMLGKKPMETLALQRHNYDGGETWVKTDYLFNDQFNVHTDSPNNADRRLFDFVVFFDHRNGRLLDGYYVTECDELNELRANRYQCGYCGRQDEQEGICGHCNNSPYLEFKNLPLLVKTALTAERQKPTDEQAEQLAKIWKARKEN